MDEYGKYLFIFYDVISLVRMNLFGYKIFQGTILNT